jgi:hypothetical protein
MRIAILVVCLVLAAAGLFIGLQQAFQDDEPTREERIHDFQQTITVSQRRIDRARTALAELELTPVPSPTSGR